jgi:hypothetical protein
VEAGPAPTGWTALRPTIADHRRSWEKSRRNKKSSFRLANRNYWTGLQTICRDGYAFCRRVGVQADCFSAFQPVGAGTLEPLIYKEDICEFLLT